MGRKWTTSLDGWWEELGLAGVLSGSGGVGCAGVDLGEMGLSYVGWCRYGGVSEWGMC